MIGPFCTHSPICLNIGFCDMTDLYVNDSFSMIVLSTKKLYFSFLKKFFIIQKICFKVKVLKTLKVSTDYHIKACRSLKGRAILKIPSTVFRRTHALAVGIKMKPLIIVFSSVKTKTNSSFAVELAERSNHSFLLSIWWITFFKYLYSLIYDNGMYRT